MRSQAGSTLVEVIVVVAIMGIGLGMASMYLKPIEAPLSSATSLVESYLREARLNAIASTSAYRVTPETTGRLKMETGDSCSASTWVGDGSKLELPNGVSTSPSNWIVCFSSRGIAGTNVVITLDHDQYDAVQIEVLVGGTTRELG